MKINFFPILLISILLVNSANAQWVVTSGPAQPNIVSLATSGLNTFATAGAAVSITSNNGINWSVINNGLTGNIYTVVTKGNDIFVGASGGAVFQSANNGVNWTNVSTGLSAYDVRSLAVSGSDIYAGSFGVFKSVNNGLSWTQLNQTWTANVSNLAVSGSTILAATPTAAIYLSTDGGTSWTNSSSGLPMTINAVEIFGSTFIAGTNLGIFISTDNGATWSPTNVTTEVGAFTTVGANVFAGGTNNNGVFLSTDNGNTWSTINNGLTNLTVYSLAANSTYLFAGTTGYVWRRLLSEVISTTNINSEIPEDDLVVYPNPSSGRFMLNPGEISSVKIYNSLGQLFYSKNQLIEKEEIELSTKGIYTVVISGINSDLIQVKKVVIE